jgi:hypothetical protein
LRAATSLCTREDPVTRSQQFAHVTLVHADEGNGSIAACGRRGPERLAKKICEGFR